MEQEPVFELSNRPMRRDEAFWEALLAQEAILPAEDGDAAPAPAGPPPPLPADPWQAARECMAADQVVKLQVVGCNRGGLLVNWHRLPGFVPASHLLNLPYLPTDQQRLHYLQLWVGRWLDLKIIDVSPPENRLILSERAAQVAADQREGRLAEIETGDTLTGTVTTLTDFGVFLDLGGVEGLLHISELSWSRVPHPGKILQVGQTSRVLVLAVDRENGRIALSRKRLHPNPWRDVDQRYQPGQVVNGVVTNVVSYGAFVQLESELEGLIHISEMADGDFSHPRNLLQVGQAVRARVLSVDGPRQRLALSLRALPPA